MNHFRILFENFEALRTAKNADKLSNKSKFMN